MFHGMHFSMFRLTILVPVLLAQIFLFLYIRKAILSSRWKGHFKHVAVIAVGLVISLLCAVNTRTLIRNVVWVNPSWEIRTFLFYLPAVWVFASILSALLLGLAQLIAGLSKIVACIGRKRFVHDPGRRRFLQSGAAALAIAPFIVSGYGASYVSRKGKVTELALPFGCPMRVVQLTDIHAGVYMVREDIRRYVETVIALKPDLFVVTGDFISDSMAFLPDCMEEIIRVRARYGTFATLGNHENWFGKLSELKAIFKKYGIPLLVNAHEVVQTAHGSFAVAGIDDLRSGRPSLEKALLGLDHQIPTLLLSHHPEIFPQAAERRIPLTLAGHYHGGQIKLNLPGISISPAHFITPYPEGLYRMGDSRLYVSRGIGTTFTPIRLGVPAEITLLHLT